MNAAFKTLPELSVAGGLFSDGDWVESKDQDPQGVVRLIQLSDIGDGVFRDRSSRFVTPEKVEELGGTYLRPGDVLIARMPDPLGRACIFPDIGRPAITAVDVCIFRPPKGINPKFVAHMINAPQFRSEVSSLQSGTTRKRISRKNLGTIALPVPDTAVQDAVVEEIEKQFTRLDAGVSAMSHARSRLVTYRSALLQAATSGRLAPGDYKTALLGEVSTMRLGKMLSQASLVGKDPLPYLRNINVRWDRVDTGDLLMMDFTEREKEEFRLQVGDVLVCEGGEPGRAAVWEDQAPGALFQKALHRVRVDRERLLPKYLVIHLWADALAGRLARYFTGSTIKHFTGVQLKKYEIHFPQLEVQERIINDVLSKLSVVEVLERQIDAEVERAAALRKAVLGRAFIGGLLDREAA